MLEHTDATGTYSRCIQDDVGANPVSKSFLYRQLGHTQQQSEMLAMRSILQPQTCKTSTRVRMKHDCTYIMPLAYLRSHTCVDSMPWS
jgi:hypothetical protein